MPISKEEQRRISEAVREDYPTKFYWNLLYHEEEVGDYPMDRYMGQEEEEKE